MSVVFCKTPSPGIPRAVLLELILIDGKPAGIPLQKVVFLLTALRTDPQWLADIQREHFHKVFAVYLMLMVGNHHRESTPGGNADKILHILR